MSLSTAQSAAADGAGAAIAAVNAEFSALFARGDAAGLAALYGDGASVLPPNGEPVSGRSAIQALWQGALDAGVKGAKLETLEVEDCADTTYEVGRYSLTGAGGQEIDRGKYLVIWRRAGGRWQIHRDIWNSSVPPAGGGS